MTETTDQQTTRAQRMAMPLAREVVQDLAVEHGACIRPIQLRRTNLDTGEVDRCSSRAGTPWPRSARPAPSGPRRCGPRSAGKAGTSRTNPTSPPTRPPRTRSGGSPCAPKPSSTATRPPRPDTTPTDFDELITELDDEITNGRHPRESRPGQASAAAPLDPAPPGRPGPAPRQGQPPDGRQDLHRPGRQDLPPVAVPHADLPVLRPGRRGRSTRRPGTYEYDRAARDALAFAALFDRFIQNLRRYLGYDVQYFAAIEPQQRLAPHVHIAMRGTVARAEIRRVLAATYHQVWWPDTSTVKYDGDELPVWDEHTGNYLDPATGEVLPTWDQALDELGDQPHHVARFGDRFDAQGVLAGLQGRRPVHRLPDQVPDQAGRRLPPRRDRRAAGPCGPAGRGAAVPAVLAAVRELAPLRHPAQERPARPGPRLLQGQGPRRRSPRLRRAAGAGLPQVVRQDPGRPPGRPPGLAAEHARCFGN